MSVIRRTWWNGALLVATFASVASAKESMASLEGPYAGGALAVVSGQGLGAGAVGGMRLHEYFALQGELTVASALNSTAYTVLAEPVLFVPTGKGILTLGAAVGLLGLQNYFGPAYGFTVGARIEDPRPGMFLSAEVVLVYATSSIGIDEFGASVSAFTRLSVSAGYQW